MKKGTLDKVRKQLADVSALVDFWWQTVWHDLEQMALPPRWKQWVDELLLPLMYWQEQLSRTRCPGQKAQMALALQAIQDAFERHPCTQLHIPHPFSWIYEGFSRSALKRNLTRPYRSLPGLFSLPLPDVMTGMSPLANLRTDESGRPLSSPSWPPPYGPAPSISVCYGAFGSCACPPHLMRYSAAL
jgi:hypothetical protein